MENVIAALKDTPIPTILVVAGVVFLLLSIAGQLAGRIAVPPERQRWSAIMGGFLLAIGIVLHVIPQSSEPQEPRKPATPAPSLGQQPPPGGVETLGTSQPSSASESPLQVLIEEKEPNNSITDASLITEGATARGSLADKQDRDWFKFTASAKEARVIIRKLVQMEVDVYDHSENRIANDAEPLDQTITIAFKSTRGAIYYIVVKEYYAGGGDYELVVRQE